MPRFGPPPRVPARERPLGPPLAVVCALAAACAPELPAPDLRGLSPEFGYNGEDTPVEIYGEGFYPSVGARSGGDVEWDRDVEAWLIGADGEQSRLTSVSLVDYQTITATVPEGLEPGYYDLRLLTPGGDEATLEEAYEVTDTRVDHLEVLIEESVLAVGEYAVLEIHALDPEGAVVREALPISVELAVDGDPFAVSFAATPALAGQNQLEDVLGVEGSLEATGIGFLAITSSAPASISLVVGPSEEGSRVSTTVASLSFEPGPVSAVRVALPPFVAATAGEPFEIAVRLLDEDGNETPDTQALLYLHESCPNGTFGETVFVIGEESREVAVTGATNLECSENRIMVAGVADGRTFEGESEAFQVLPAAPSELWVAASPSALTAGEDALVVAVSARDAWGNVVEDYAASLELRDSAGGLDPASGIGVQSCTDLTEGLAIAFCEARLWVTGEEVTVEATDSNGLYGLSNAFAVRAGDLADLEVEVGTTEVTAGESFEVVVRPTDVHGNTLPVEPELLGLLSFADDQGAVGCARDASDAELGDGARFSCTIQTVDGADALAVTLSTPELTLSALSAAFAVVNGPLAFVDIELDGVSQVEAGESLTLSIAGYDAYDNPYATGGDRSLTLSDDTGSLALTTGGTVVNLDSDGRISAEVSFTVALQDNRVYASGSAGTLGRSDAFDVLNGAFSELSLELEASWAWVDEPFAVSVSALDAWGNPVQDYGEELTLRSGRGLGEALSSSAWEGGVLALDFVFDEEGLGDTITAEVDGEVLATSDALDALRADCASGPTADLRVGGDAPATLCLSGGTTPLTSVSASRSAPGGSALAWYHVDLGDGEWTRSSTAARSTTWTEEGALRVTVVVADRAACGDTASVEVYVAEADGRPAGPLTVALDDDTLNAGVDAAVVTVQALDCAGDPAEGTLQAWGELGRVEAGPTSAFEATGAGLSVEVVAGEADLSWSMLDEANAGEATLRVGTSTGAAFGSATATVSGDQVRPRVLAMSPRGSTTEPFDQITLQLSEPIDEDSLDRLPTTLTERGGTPYVVSGLELDEARETLTISLEETVTPGELTLTVPAELRDDAGNRLDGALVVGGGPSQFSLTFGDVTSEAPDVTGCSPDQSTFRPDGDDGAGEEADQVTLDAYATERPAWWRLEVTDGEAEGILLERVRADSATDPLTWDGRGLDGLLVAPGEYTLTVTAEDAYWNTGTPCSTTVTVAQRVMELP